MKKYINIIRKFIEKMGYNNNEHLKVYISMAVV